MGSQRAGHDWVTSLTHRTFYIFRRKDIKYKASGIEIIKHCAFCFSDSWETLANRQKQTADTSRAGLQAFFSLFSHLLVMWPQASFSFFICKEKLILPNLLAPQEFYENKISLRTFSKLYSNSQTKGITMLPKGEALLIIPWSRVKFTVFLFLSPYTKYNTKSQFFIDRLGDIPSTVLSSD